MAWVTHGGGEKLQERLCIRPTSETIICSMYAKWVQSHRDLPILLNQWANVLRWERPPGLSCAHRIPLAGGTHGPCHAAGSRRRNSENAGVYKGICGECSGDSGDYRAKERKEKFAGADHTHTMEAMMLDGRALQMGTSHNLGQNFAKGFGIQYLDKDSKLKYPWQTSWGTSTRMIGGLIMVHGDDRGLKLPPKSLPFSA